MNKTRKIIEFLDSVAKALDERAKDTYIDSDGVEQYRYASKKNELVKLKQAIKRPTKDNISEAMSISGQREYIQGQQYEANYILDNIWRIINED